MRTNRLWRWHGRRALAPVLGWLGLAAAFAQGQTPPVITQPPVGLTAVAGSGVMLGVGVTGPGPFSYQWQFNGTNLPNNLITTVAGRSYVDGNSATNASLSNPSAVAVDSKGNVFIVDLGHNRIRKLAPDGTVTTVAGGGGGGDGGAATNASLLNPNGVAVDNGGNLFIADSGANRIRKVDTNGIITTVAGGGTMTYYGQQGTATLAALNNPTALAVTATGDLFIADTGNHLVRKVDVGGIISCVAGRHPLGGGFSGDGGAATLAALNGPSAVAVDNGGNLFITDSGNTRIRKVDTNGIITTFAGNGVIGYSGDGGAATNASLSKILGTSYSLGVLAVDGGGNLFIADRGNCRIRKVDTQGIITTVAGNGANSYYGDGGAATNASTAALAVAVDGSGNLLIADLNSLIRKVDTNGIISTLASNGSYGDGGPATAATLLSPNQLAVDAMGNLFISDSANGRIRKVDNNGIISTVAGNGLVYSGDGGPAILAGIPLPGGVAVDQAGNLFIADGAGNPVWESDYYPMHIRKVDTNGVITTVAGNSFGKAAVNGEMALSAEFPAPGGVAIDGFGNLFITDGGDHRICKVDTNGIITVIAGNLYGTGIGLGDGQPATNANLNIPVCVLVDPVGNVYIADSGTYRIRKVDTNGIIATVAGKETTSSGDGGPATEANIGRPVSLALDGAGNLFISSESLTVPGAGSIRKVDTNGIITTVAGGGSAGFSGDGGPATNALLNSPNGVAVDAVGNLFIADTTNNRVRKVHFGGLPQLSLGNLSVTNAGFYRVIVSNPYGSVTSAVANVSVVPASLNAVLPPGGGGQLQLQFTGVSGVTYVLETAPDLTPPIHWQPTYTNTAAADGHWSFTDPSSANLPFRYYRLVQP